MPGLRRGRVPARVAPGPGRPRRAAGDDRRPGARGRGGRRGRWLELDEDAFYEAFYCVSVTRCYPGRHPSGRGDRPATPAEQALCSFWLDWELRLQRPRLVLPVGGLAVARLLGRRRLTECIGVRHALGEAVAVPLPHPSGASGWLNDEGNRERLDAALALVRQELAHLS